MTQNIFDPIDSARLAKAGITDLFDMLLLTPTHYEDRRIATHINTNCPSTFEVVVESHKETPKYLSFKLYCTSLDIPIEAMFFQKTRYLKLQFAPQKTMFLYGKLVQGPFGYQIIHPKVLSSASGITPHYKISIRSDIYAKLTHRYITEDNISKLCLPNELAKEIFKIHHPDDDFLMTLLNGNFSENSEYALKFIDLFAFLVKFSQKKSRFPSRALKSKNINDFEKQLPFNPTNSQKIAFLDVLSDVTKNMQARRIIIGDVGSGKTVVIAFAAFLALPNKTLVLAPTSVLAIQLYGEMVRFLPKDTKISLLTQKNKLSDDVLQETQVLVGTHALLYKKLPSFDIIIVDEQHRFGSAQRGTIEKLTSDGEIRAHYLQFSATPIPRSQALVNSAIVDVTLMKELPFEKNIDTKVVSRADFGEILQKISEEIAQNRQVIIVYPLVEESENIDYLSIEEGASFWIDRFDGVFVTHGKDKDKEEILEKFKNDGKILVATTLVEVGVSLPNLSTIVIVAAERLGLATLHQLRGRVSRNGLKGYCYLFTNNPENERLREFCVTQSGFDIAELDLKYRNAGDLLGGVVQSGKSFKWFDYATDESVAIEVKNHFEKIG
jgi:ATP-dependent DNA helicase RecG